MSVSIVISTFFEILFGCPEPTHRDHRGEIPATWAAMNIGPLSGEIPAKVSVRLRASVTAGFANEVDEVNQYAAVM
jgi:hypothetical protein